MVVSSPLCFHFYVACSIPHHGGGRSVGEPVNSSARQDGRFPWGTVFRYVV